MQQTHGMKKDWSHGVGQRDREGFFLKGGGEKTRSEMIEGHSLSGHSVLSYHCKVDMIALLNDSE